VTRDHSNRWNSTIGLSITGLPTTGLIARPYKPSARSIVLQNISIKKEERHFERDKGRISGLKVRTVDLDKGDLVVSMCDGVWDGFWEAKEKERKLKEIIGGLIGSPYGRQKGWRRFKRFDPVQWEKDFEKKWQGFSGKEEIEKKEGIEKREDLFVQMWERALVKYLEEKQALSPEQALSPKQIVEWLVRPEVAENSRDNASAVITEVREEALPERKVLSEIGPLKPIWIDIEKGIANYPGDEEMKRKLKLRIEQSKHSVEQAMLIPSSANLTKIKKRIGTGNCVYHPDWQTAEVYTRRVIGSKKLGGFEKLRELYLNRVLEFYDEYVSDESEFDLAELFHRMLSYTAIKTQEEKLKRLFS